MHGSPCAPISSAICNGRTAGRPLLRHPHADVQACLTGRAAVDATLCHTCVKAMPL